MSGSTVLTVAVAVAVIAMLVTGGWIWLQRNATTNLPRSVGVAVLAAVLLSAAAVVGALGGIWWLVLYPVIGLPVLAAITYQQMKRRKGGVSRERGER